MSFLLELADTIADLALPEIKTEPTTCEGCKYLRNEHCVLWSVFCLNNPCRPYWTPQLQEAT